MSDAGLPANHVVSVESLSITSITIEKFWGGPWIPAVFNTLEMGVVSA